MNTRSDKPKSVKGKAKEIKKPMVFTNTGIKGLKKKEKENEDKIKELSK